MQPSDATNIKDEDEDLLLDHSHIHEDILVTQLMSKE
jgi:hypothetical protein